MREIKFRGRDEHGEWHYGAFMGVSFDGVVAPIEYANIYDDGMANRVLPDTVGQFTGMCDCDGHEIYEGDVLKNLYGHLGVSYKQEWAAFVACGVDKTGYYHEYLLDEIVNTPVRRSEIKVIGNIHDNPELLEQRS